MTRVLLSGASGYVGVNLSKELIKQGFSLAYLSRSKIEEFDAIWIDSKTEFSKEFIRFAPDITIHLATDYGRDGADKLCSCNIALPIKIMDLISTLEVSKRNFIPIGSYWQYGDSAASGVPIDLYSASKAALEPFFSYFATYKATNILELILYGTYGKKDGRGKILDLMIDAAKNDRVLKLSPGKQNLNLLHVDDVIKGIIESINVLKNNKGYSQYSIRSNNNLNLVMLADLISTYKKLKVNFGYIDYREVEIFNPVYKDNILPGWVETIDIEGFIHKEFMEIHD
jgi:CDP-paratose synthetase